MSNTTDNSLIQIFLPIINAGLIADGFTGVTVKQANQPTQQGIDTGPTVYFFKVSSKRYGWLGRNDVWNPNTMQMQHFESQYFESAWQMQALVLQDPTTPNQYTASDLISEVSDIMQSDNTRAILNSSGIGILRITDITNPYFTDDRDNFEAIPSFDMTFVYENVRTSVDPVVTQFSAEIYPI
jgi:hypothetical protein